MSGGLESVEYGIDLSVVPQFLADNTICNTLTMTLSFPVTQAGTSDLSLDKYTIESTIVCKVGQSIVISGIAEQIENEENAHTPLLGSIPHVRLLFSESNCTFKNSEIVAIITPRVMNAELNDLRTQNVQPRLTELQAGLAETDLKSSMKNVDLQDKASRREAALAAKKAQREAALAEKQAARDRKLAARDAARQEAEAKAAAKRAAAEAKQKAAAEKSK